jgi:hypothetical protein
MSLRTKLDPNVRTARRERVQLANTLAVKALKAGSGSPLGIAYGAAVVALERLRKLSGINGTAKEWWKDKIMNRVRMHEAKALAEAEESLAANVALTRHQHAAREMLKQN